ncbi:hypothetical protein FQR65_LT10835 [Abscondita terminalis]|nr:hypothetical protein FQR65_LT10835 [Abscondita terminalis]
MSKQQEILGVIRGLQAVAQAGLKLQEQTVNEIWRNSSIKTVLENATNIKSNSNFNINQSPEEIIKIISDTGDRLFTVADGVNKFVAHSFATTIKDQQFVKPLPIDQKNKFTQPTSNLEHKITLSASDKELLKKLDMEHREKNKMPPISSTEKTLYSVKNEKSVNETDTKEKNDELAEKKNSKYKVKAVPNPKSLQKLNVTAKERTVPSSRIARMVSFGSLAAGLGVGTAAEYMRRSVGLGSSNESSNMFLTKANMDRIVDTLCKVRGAALKLGQMLSIQDESIVNPELAKALERVRKSADFMPTWQVEQVLNTEIGPSWRTSLLSFEEKPFAAASIGQVHLARTKDDETVAIKIQYPGVAKGIESDIDNLVGIMKLWNIFPKGMFIENVVVVAKRELAWEVDYKREAECTRKFRTLLEPYPHYVVPKVIDDLSGSQVFTSEYLDGIPVDQCITLDLDHRKHIANSMFQLLLLELMEFRYMQTDPNWANFFYNPTTKKLLLLDFGASREYPKEFVDSYVRIIKAASENDRDTVIKVSQELKFLTGYESKTMEDAHVEAVMILGEAFQHEGGYSFKGRDTIARIQNLVPTMLTHRLCPPPDEVYSLHRKLSGIYLLCAKLNAPIEARSMFLDFYKKYKFDTT